jgi:RNA polymerase sigma-70 factor (ECF subfamily)
VSFEKERSVSQEPEIWLVEAAIKGDAESFTELARRYYPAMVAIAHSIISDRDLAEDAVQSSLARAAVKLPQLKEHKKFAGWLATICRNTAKDIARGRKGGFTGFEVSRDTARDTNGNDCDEVVKEALKRLSESAREVIYLRYYDGLSYEQISSVLGISEQAINGRLRRAKKKMAEFLRHEGFGRS